MKIKCKGLRGLRRGGGLTEEINLGSQLEYKSSLKVKVDEGHEEQRTYTFKVPITPKIFFGLKTYPKFSEQNFERIIVFARILDFLHSLQSSGFSPLCEH